MKHKHAASGRRLRRRTALLLRLIARLLLLVSGILLLRNWQPPSCTANMTLPAGICMSNLPPHILQKLAVSFGFGGRTASACACVTNIHLAYLVLSMLMGDNMPANICRTQSSRMFHKACCVPCQLLPPMQLQLAT